MKFYGLVVRMQVMITAFGFSGIVFASQFIPNNVSITGIYARPGSDIKIIDGGSILIQNQGLGNGNANGLVELNNGKVDLGNGTTINALGGWGNPNLAGISLNGTAGDSHVVANNLTITTTTDPTHSADTAIGIGSFYTGGSNIGSTINLTGLTTIDVKATTNAASAYSTYGIYLDGSGVSLTADKLKIDVLYDNAAKPTNMGVAGILAVRNGQQLAYQQADITVTNNTAGSTAYGIQNAASLTGGDTTIAMNGGGTNQTLVGIDTDTMDTNTKTVLSGNTQVNINAGGDNSSLDGVFVENKLAQYSQQSGNINIGLNSKGYANTTVNGLRVNSLGGNSAINNLDIDVNNLNIINNNNVNADSHFVYAQNGGNVSIKANNLAFVDNATQGIKDAITAEGNSTINITSQQTNVKGNIVTDANSTVNFNASKGSFTGEAKNNGGTVNLVLSNSLTWNMTGTSNVNSLTLDNSSLNFKSDPSTNNYYQLNVADLTNGNNATIGMNVNMAEQTGDKVVVSNSSSGHYNLQIANNGSAKTTGQEVVTVVDNSLATGTTAATYSANKVEAGGYQYALQQNGKQQQLRSTGRITSTASASANFLNSSYLLNYIDTQTLLQRMGDLRGTDGQEGNFWVRGFAGKLNSFSGDKLHGYSMDYNGFQVGIDKLIPMTRGNLYVGVMAGYTHANPDYDGGTGTVKDTNAGIYGTYIDNSGFYVDTVAKYIRMRNNFNVKDTLGQKVDGNAKSNGYSFSVETGKRFAIEQSNFYVEPQLQLSYASMGDATTHASNGLKVKLDSYESLLGRGSIITGYQIKNSDNPIDLYIKTGYVREFMGNTSYKLNDNKEKHDFGGGWFDSALGVNAQINKRHNIYSEVSYSAGSRFDKQQINLGYRYQF